MSASARRDVLRFHNWSHTYERSLGQVFLFDPVHRKVVGLVAARLDGNTPHAVLDIGCGTGRLLRRVARQWPRARLFGVDPAEGMLDNARRLTPGATFLAGQGESLPMADESINVAFSTVSFHHWADQAAGVREVARVLRGAGVFCLADGALPGIASGIIPHSRIHTREEMADLFFQAGLTVVAQAGILGGAIVATVGMKS